MIDLHALDVNNMVEGNLVLYQRNWDQSKLIEKF